MSNNSVRSAAIGAACLAITMLLSATAYAADEDASGWKDTAEFSYVLTAGNSETNTLGLKNTLSRKWGQSGITIKAGAIRAESTTRASFGVGALDDFEIPSTTDTTAEVYYLNGRYDRKITERFFWYAGAGWDRNVPAGIDNRTMAMGGVGNVWFDEEDHKFRTDYALTYTNQKDVVDNPAVDDSFLGARVSWDYLNMFGENTTYENALVVDLNLDETSDYRADMINSIAVAMNKRMALKVSLQWLYDAEPALKLVEVYDLPPGEGGILLGTVPVELDDLDTIFTASLVVNF